MSRRLAPAGARERAVETAAALVALALYAVMVSRGEALPYVGAARALTAPTLALALAVLIGWRLRRVLFGAEAIVFARAWALPAGIALLAAGACLIATALAGPARPDEEAVLALAVRIILDEHELVPARDAITTALGWLHAPAAAVSYLAGVSAGRWREIDEMTPAAVLPWSRALHAGLSLLTVALAGWAAGRLGGRTAGLLAAALLAVSGAGVAAGAAVDGRAPLGLLVALLLAVGAGVRGRRRWRWAAGSTRPVFGGLLIAAVVGLWLPGLVGAALAPAAAVASGLAGQALWPRGRRAGD